MGRLRWVSSLLILTGLGPALAQVTYPNCSSGWEWVGVSNFLYIGAIFVPDRGPILPVVQQFKAKPMQRGSILGVCVQWWS
jgi:hypothetical protein